MSARCRPAFSVDTFGPRMSFTRRSKEKYFVERRVFSASKNRAERGFNVEFRLRHVTQIEPRKRPVRVLGIGLHCTRRGLGSRRDLPNACVCAERPRPI